MQGTLSARHRTGQSNRHVDLSLTTRGEATSRVRVESKNGEGKNRQHLPGATSRSDSDLDTDKQCVTDTVRRRNIVQTCRGMFETWFHQASHSRDIPVGLAPWCHLHAILQPYCLCNRICILSGEEFCHRVFTFFLDAGVLVVRNRQDVHSSKCQWRPLAFRKEGLFWRARCWQVWGPHGISPGTHGKPEELTRRVQNWDSEVTKVIYARFRPSTPAMHL